MLDNRVAHGEAEAGALSGRLRRDEGIEHVLEDGTVDTWTIVGDDERDTSLDGHGAHFDRALAREGIGRIEKQVQQQLTQPLVIASNARQRLVDSKGELDVSKARLLFDELDRVIDDIGQARRALDVSRRRFVAREVEQVANGVVDSLGLTLKALQELSLLLGIEVTTLHQLQHPSNRRERVSNLMRDARGKAAYRCQTRTTHQLLLRGGELGGRLLELVEPILQRRPIDAKLGGHVVEGAREPRDLGGTANRHARSKVAFGHPLGSPAYTVDRPNDEVGQQDVGEQQDDERGQAQVEDEESASGRVTLTAERRPYTNRGPSRETVCNGIGASDGAPKALDGAARQPNLDPGNETVLDHLVDPLGVELESKVSGSESLRHAQGPVSSLLGVLVLVEARAHHAKQHERRTEGDDQREHELASKSEADRTLHHRTLPPPVLDPPRPPVHGGSMTRHARFRVIVGSILILSASGAGSARADRDGDGLYGRWDRGLTLALGAGAGATWISRQADVSVVGEARFLVADVAGLALSGRWGPDSGQHLFVGVDLRPLFPALFFLYKQTWNEFADLLLQSIYLELGAAFLLDGHRSSGLGVGFGFGIPLYRPLTTVRGLWLRVGARHVDANPSYRNTQPDVERSEWTLFVTFVVRLGFKANIGTWEPRRLRYR